MSAADQVDWLSLSERCHRLQDRGLSRDLAVDVYFAGNLLVVAGLEAGTDAQLREVSRLHEARARAAAEVRSFVTVHVDVATAMFERVLVECLACVARLDMPLLWDGDQA